VLAFLLLASIDRAHSGLCIEQSTQRSVRLERHLRPILNQIGPRFGQALDMRNHPAG